MLPSMVAAEQATSFQTVQQLGLNFTETAGDGELSDSIGLSTEFFPCLTQRRSRTAVDGYSDPTDMFEWDGHRVVIDGTQLLYDRSVLCQVQAGKKQFAVVNTKMIVWPDKIMIDMTNGTFRRMDETVQASAGTATVVSNSVLNIYPNRLSINNLYALRAGNYWYHGLATAPVWQDGAWVSTGDITHAVPGIAAVWGLDDGDTRIGNTLYMIPYKTELGEYAFEIKSFMGMQGEYYNINVAPTEALFEHEPNTDGVYGRITEIVMNTLSWEVSLVGYKLRGQLKFKYDLYDATSGTRLLTDYFSVGDFVDISGLNAGDLKTKKILAIDDSASTLTFDAGTFTGTGTQTGAVTVQRNIPALDFICSKNNRLYGVSNSVENRIWNADTEQYEVFNSRCLYVSALGLPMNFWDFEGLSTDSYQVAIGSNGDFTGICSYGNAVLCWKENIMHRLTGDFPAEFYLTDSNIFGVQAGSHRAMQIINDVLYYKGVNGVFTYTGGVPQLISYNLGTEILTDAVGGTDGMHYYLSAQRPDGTWRLLTYDLKHGLWLQESAEEADAFALAGGVFYIMTGGAIYATGNGSENISWLAEYAPTYETHVSNYSQQATHNRKDYLRLLIRVEYTGTLVVEYRTDGGDWKTATAVSTDHTKVLTVPLPRMRCDKFQFRLSGVGTVTIRTIERELTVGSKK